MSTDPPPVEQDSRGILQPWLLQRHVQLTRYPAGPALEGVVEMFWAVQWGLPDGMVHRQPLLTRPGGNLSVGHTDADLPDYDPSDIEARCYGIVTGLATRALSGSGWTVAALTTVGGLGAFHAESVTALTDRKVPLDTVLKIDSPTLIRYLVDEPEISARAAVLADTLTASLRPDRLEGARAVSHMAKLAETDRGIRMLADLADATGTGPRTLQRMFREYAGVAPTWVLRRYRLMEAAESVRGGEQVRWADVAADLGYADQAHLTRDFRAATGQTPAAYAASAQAEKP